MIGAAGANYPSVACICPQRLSDGHPPSTRWLVVSVSERSVLVREIADSRPVLEFRPGPKPQPATSQAENSM